MIEKIQLPVRYKQGYKTLVPIYRSGIYVIQMPDALKSGYPIVCRHRHADWFYVEERGLIKIGITINFVQERMRALTIQGYEYFILNHGELSKPSLICSGFAYFPHFARGIEKWIHHTLHSNRIPARDMYQMGGEWFIPTDEVVRFLWDVFSQLNEADIGNGDDIRRLLPRLARIKQNHFGGILIEPKLDKAEYEAFHAAILKQKRYEAKLKALKAEREQNPSGFTKDEANFLSGMLKMFTPKDE